MKIRITNRIAVEKLAANPFPQKTALISITDYGSDFAELKNKPLHLCQVSFDDVDNDVLIDELGRNATDAERKSTEEKYHMLSEAQAAEIAGFYFSVRNEVDCLICQCEHGQSRSAAVAAAIMEYRSRKGISVFADDRYYPNKVVFRKVLAALQDANKQ
ncbi:MAG: hypothetical protein ACI3YE_02960 [Candidatus Avispirillum sp.]